MGMRAVLVLGLLASSALADVQPWDLHYPKRERAKAAYRVKLQKEKAATMAHGAIGARSNLANIVSNSTDVEDPFDEEASIGFLDAEADGFRLQKRATTTTSSKSTTTTAPSTTKTTVKSNTATTSTTTTATPKQPTSSTTKTTTAVKTTTTTTTKMITTTTTTKRATTTTKTTAKAAKAAATTTTTTLAATCAPLYTGARVTITGTGTLPKPTTWVKRSGQQLTLNGSPFRMVGPNIYWLCNDENVLPVGYYTDKGRVREALAIAVAMGANTVRLTTCATSVGHKYLLEPTLEQFATEASWDIHDYVIYAAGQYGLRVVLPLTDNYNYYHGGKYTFIKWSNVSTRNYGSAFFDNSAVYAAYRDYIRVVLNRRNTYNGKRYREDPTIIAWETGNELGGYVGREGYPPFAWTDLVASLIKGLAPYSLVIDGTDGFWNYTTKAIAPGGRSQYVDIVTDHSYPRNLDIVTREVIYARSFDKNFLIGEFDWTGNYGGDDLNTYLSAVLKQPTLGAMVWNVLGHDAQCCKFVPHNDGYSIYYPNGNSASDQALILQVSRFFYRLTGRSQPTSLVAVACPQPVF